MNDTTDEYGIENPLKKKPKEIVIYFVQEMI